MTFTIFMSFMKLTLHVQGKEYYKWTDFSDAACIAYVAIIPVSHFFLYIVSWYDTVKPKQFYIVHYHNRKKFCVKMDVPIKKSFSIPLSWYLKQVVFLQTLPSSTACSKKGA